MSAPKKTAGRIQKYNAENAVLCASTLTKMVSLDSVLLAPDVDLPRAKAIAPINKVSATMIGNSFVDRSAARARAVIRTASVIRLWTTGASLSEDLCSIQLRHGLERDYIKALQRTVENICSRVGLVPFSVSISYQRQCFPIPILEIKLVIFVTFSGCFEYNLTFAFPKKCHFLTGGQFEEQIFDSIDGIS
ncbi:MAG: hypothetical protein Q9215_005021 [Flavoplaca cf. flavocitrina]